VGEVCLFLPDFGRKLCVKLIITYKMKEQMKRTVYEAPLTELFQIELEGGLMQSSVKTEIKTEDTSFEVEEYDSFENQITFE